ncbi:MAG: hypothetical protein H7345_00475 [Rubritepida sp.]|nr:hypothetical protein [Rubritepida sp.]
MSGFFNDEFAEGSFLRGEGYSTSIDPVDSAARFFDGAADVFDAVGWRPAADNLRRYRSGVGGNRDYTDEEIAAHSPFLQAEDVNRSRFEALTFTARTGDAPLNQRLLNFEDGELMEGYDFFRGLSPTVALRLLWLLVEPE